MSQDRELSIADLLADLSQEGQVVSSESDFTLDARKAQDKLKKFQLPNPFFYVLKLVQSAVLAGAREIRVECAPHQISFHHDGMAPTQDELNELLSYLLASEKQKSENGHVVRLASAVNTAVAAHARVLELECCDGEKAYKRVWSAKGCQFTELGQRSDSGVKFVLKRKATDMASSLRHVGDTRLIDLVKGHRNSIQKEEAALWDRAIFCPVPILVDGKPICRTGFGTPRHPGAKSSSWAKVPFFHWYRNRASYHSRYCHNRFHLIQAYYPSEDAESLNLIAPSEAHSFLTSSEYPHEPGLPCSLVLGIEANRDYRNRVNFLKEGVVVKQVGRKASTKGVFALVSAADLETDLTGFQLRTNQAYSEKLKHLDLAIHKLLKEIGSRKAELAKVYPMP